MTPSYVYLLWYVTFLLKVLSTETGDWQNKDLGHNVSLETRRKIELSALLLGQEVTDRNTLFEKESADLSAFCRHIRQNFDMLISHLGNPKTCEITHSAR